MAQDFVSDLQMKLRKLERENQTTLKMKEMRFYYEEHLVLIREVRGKIPSKPFKDVLEHRTNTQLE